VSWYSPIIAPVKSFFSRSLSTKSDPTYQVTAQFYTPGQPMWSDRNYHAFVVEGYKKCGPVYACVQKIAQAAAGVKWKLYTDESMKREIPSHPLLDLWRKPNPRMGSSELVEQIFGFWHLAGNSYLYASRLNPNEPPVELWPLFPDQMKIVAGQGDIAGYVYGYGGPNPRVFELEDIMHLKFASYDERSFYGLSPIEVAMRTIDRLNAGNEWNMALMQNSGQPSALFTSKSHLTVEQRNQIKSELRKKYSGKRNAGMPLVLEADMGYQQMAINPKELDWLESVDDDPKPFSWRLSPKMVRLFILGSERSDGLDREAGEGLAEEMQRLHKSCKQLIWLNPLLRYDKFEARPAGVRAMLPHVDRFLPVHNLKSLIDLSRALPCLGKAGSVTVHHVRAVHGSATNFSGRERRFLLYQYRAADAWPLLGFKDGIDRFNELLLAGEPTIEPRLAAVPVRLPLPPAEHQGSIYENQRASARRYFTTAGTARAAAE